MVFACEQELKEATKGCEGRLRAGNAMESHLASLDRAAKELSEGIAAQQEAVKTQSQELKALRYIIS